MAQSLSADEIFKKVLESVKDYKSVADKIIEYCTKGPGKGRSYFRLSEFCDKFGSRFSGTQALEDAIDFMLEELKKEGFDDVHGEEANVTHWVRNEATALLLSPVQRKIAITALGSSISTLNGNAYMFTNNTAISGSITPVPDAIEADAIVFKTFEDMEERAKDVEGKIVIFNQDWNGYDNTSTYRFNGAGKAAKFGAVATLIRSVTPFSLYTLHTGWQDYVEGVKKIPTACITVEDAEMFTRMQASGEELRIRMFMNCEMYDDAKSRNTIAEFKGTKFPDEKVLVSGHMDCWDLGVGAMDDGGGAFVSREALSVLKDLQLRPKRSIMLCLFTGEETNLGGSLAFHDKYKSQADKFSIIMETDEGTFTPTGLAFKGSEKAEVILSEIAKLLQPIGADYLGKGNEVEVPDLDAWDDTTTPKASLLNQNEKYFWFHHSHADHIKIQDPDAMDRCTALWAIYAYIIADLDIMLPR